MYNTEVVTHLTDSPAIKTFKCICAPFSCAVSNLLPRQFPCNGRSEIPDFSFSKQNKTTQLRIKDECEMNYLKCQTRERSYQEMFIYIYIYNIYFTFLIQAVSCCEQGKSIYGGFGVLW